MINKFILPELVNEDEWDKVQAMTEDEYIAWLKEKKKNNPIAANFFDFMIALVEESKNHPDPELPTSLEIVDDKGITRNIELDIENISDYSISNKFKKNKNDS